MKRSRAPSQLKSAKRRRLPFKAPRQKKSLAAKVNALIKEQEIKNFDTNVSAAAAATGGTISSSSLCLVQQGDTNADRDGKKIACKGLSIRGYCTLLPHATQSSDYARVVVYVDKQCNGAAATIAELFSTADIQTHNNPDNSNRFRILKNEIFVMNRTAFESTVGNLLQEVLAPFEWFIPLKDLPVLYDASTGAITDLTSNNIGVATFSEHGFAQVQYQARLKFVG